MGVGITWPAAGQARMLGMVLLTLLSLFAPAQADEPAERRVALVIGNGAYQNAAPLANPSHDAGLIGETLTQLGFSLVGGAPLIDADKGQMEQAIREFGRQIKDGAIGLFYYSGHGIQVNGTNYLIPVAANIASDVDVKYELVDVGYVLDEMTHAGNRLNIVILDACRNNPFARKGTRAVSSGLGQVLAPAGTVIGYATQPDNVAADGAGANSPYTAALAQALRQPGLDLFGMFNAVGIAVKQATRGQQQPWLAASPVEGKFFFAGEGDGAAQPAADPDTVFWDSVKSSASGDDMRSYLVKFPDGKFADLARRKLLTDCDALAARPTDPDRIGAGVEPQAMDSRRAIAACKLVASDRRGGFLLGQAFEAAAQVDAALGAYRLSADQGYAPAQAALASLLDAGRGAGGADPATAVAWFRKAAEQDHAPSQLALAAHLEGGRGVARNEAEALRWYRKAADQGLAEAQLAVGRMIGAGRGAARDEVEALRWFRKAADQGVATAQTRIGEAYAEGTGGVSRDVAEAARWYRKAAEQGDAQAQYDLGWSYQFGLGLPADSRLAVTWYRKAAEQGHAKAKTALSTLTGTSD